MNFDPNVVVSSLNSKDREKEANGQRQISKQRTFVRQFMNTFFPTEQICEAPGRTL